MLNILNEMEAIDPIILDMSKTPIPTEYFIIITANSAVHMKSLREKLVRYIKNSELPLIYYDKGEGHDWLLIDAGDVVIHIFTREGREFYDLEGLWIDAKRIDTVKR
ncbi:MAG: ribosome silencing factor [Thermotogaceae bacterium]|nr:ribosome silencing factor [Thermotogaceae bacterium]